jgi:hypothetical protein
MKRKNLFFVSALILFGLATVNSVKAQLPYQSGSVEVKITLNPFQAIIVSSTPVELNYATAEDYNNGVMSALQPNHLTVHAIGGFTVSVRTDHDFQIGSTTTNSIPASDVKVKVGPNGGALGAPVPLSTGGSTLFTSDTGGFNKKYDVQYDNSAGSLFKYADKASGTYSAVVTYTIASN